MFTWDSKYDRYITLQRNHKSFNEEMLTNTIRLQQKDIAVINSFLKRKPKNILDIGCGLGIYDLALHDFYGPGINYYLLDKTTQSDEEAKVFYGYRKQGAFYNNMDYTRSFLESNGIDSENINLLNVKETTPETNALLIEKVPKLDLVISIISCGFHYPLSTYFDTIVQLLKDDGLLCFHCRGLEENYPLVESKFHVLWPRRNAVKSGSFLICRKKRLN